jgi:hypothetical protein
VSTEAISPISATPFAGLTPWLASLWRNLRAAVAQRAATKEEAQVLHLIEFVSARFGDPVVQASSIDDLDDQLDALVGSPDALHCTALLVQHIHLFEKSEPLSAAGFAKAVGENLGEAQGRVLSDEQQILDAWLDAQRQATRLVASHLPEESERVFELSLANPQIPAELAELIFHSLRAGFCSLAIVRLIASGSPVEPWLARALTIRLVASAKQHLRLLASLPGVTVEESIVPKPDRLDLEVLVERHHRARLASQRSLEQARTRLGI